MVQGKKINLLKLYALLRHETDEQHLLTTMAITDWLGQMSISCERRTPGKDITLLNEQGVEVMWSWTGKKKGYLLPITI